MYYLLYRYNFELTLTILVVLVLSLTPGRLILKQLVLSVTVAFSRHLWLQISLALIIMPACSHTVSRPTP